MEIERVFALVDRSNVVNIYGYGSYYYGTFHEGSDYDLIVIVNSYDKRDIVLDDMNIHLYTMKEFMQNLDDHQIEFLEAILHPLYETQPISFTIDKQKLRHIISQKADNSYVKAKKKLTVEHEIYIAKKSLFHAFKMLDFASQLAVSNTITNWTHLTDLYYEIMAIPNDSDWSVYDEKFKKRFNEAKSKFRFVAPK